MVDAILFILVMINLALTLTFIFKFSKKQENVDEIRNEMSDMIKQFNSSAERNIQLLEDRITDSKRVLNQFDQKKAQNLYQETKINKLSQAERPKQQQTSSTDQKKDEKIQIAKDLLSKIKNKRIDGSNSEPAPEYPYEEKYAEKYNEKVKEYRPPSFDHLSNPRNETRNETQNNTKNNYGNSTAPLSEFIVKPSRPAPQNSGAAKSFVQKAYSAPKQISESFTSDFASNKLDQPSHPDQTPETLHSNEKTEKFDELLSNDDSKKTIHQIAKLIGEGKSLEEISSILGLSIGEIKLFTSIVRKKLFQQ